MPDIKITPQGVQKVAALARLGLTEQEASQSADDLAGILGHFSVIQQIDTADTPTSDDVTGLQNVARTDVAQPNDLCTPDELLAAAPAVHKGQVKSKAVFS
ncbi:MAG: Asp-tRNA(Asn)/Glu-tRNA(Gln) amidotransferase subunit GatC [bacterium]|nr:Asp-tRNA(Asn)/Glu-tRNA(Gln) amidotransferase subunit GatC [bacterium]MDZ4346535.1 Asp-tRNA(Asn)/Glu-tRNA(Gln) amidotransferase subunit GatC [Candidatus Binatia bacterium]